MRQFPPNPDEPAVYCATQMPSINSQQGKKAWFHGDRQVAELRGYTAVGRNTHHGCGLRHVGRHPMDIEPPNLDIPLERKEHWGLLLVGVCCAITGLAAIFNPSFATVFAASSIVGLPVLLFLVFPSSVSARFRAGGGLGRIAFFTTVIGYLALSKKVLVPFVISVIQHALF